MSAAPIGYDGRVYLVVSAAGVPAETEFALAETHGERAALDGGVYVVLAEVALAHFLAARHEELVPEERLQAVEVEPVLFEKRQLVVVGLDVLLVPAVYDQYIIGRKLYAPYLYRQYRGDYL